MIEGLIISLIIITQLQMFTYTCRPTCNVRIIIVSRTDNQCKHNVAQVFLNRAVGPSCGSGPNHQVASCIVDRPAP